MWTGSTVGKSLKTFCFDNTKMHWNVFTVIKITQQKHLEG